MAKKSKANNLGPKSLYAGMSAEEKAQLEGLVASIQKDFGKDALINVETSGNMERYDYQTATGSIGLDIALGPMVRLPNGMWQTGTVPGRIEEVVGPEGSGKCVTKDTYLLTERGLMTVEEVFREKGFAASTRSHVEPCEFGLVNEEGCIEKTSHFTWNNRSRVITAKCRSGLRLSATPNHRVRVMSNGGQIVWRRMSSLSVGDRVVCVRGGGRRSHFGSGGLSLSEATLLGYLTADGCMSDMRRVAFSNSDEEVVAEYRDAVQAVFGQVKIRSYPKVKTATVDHHINSAQVREMLRANYGMELVTAAGKSVPLCVRTAGKAEQAEFLRAYFELECSISEEQVIEATSASERLLREVQLMLLNFGILSRVSEKPVADAMYYRLTIGGADFDRYVGAIGFHSSARMRSVAASRSPQYRNTNVDSIPGLCELIRDLFYGCDTDREGDRICRDVMTGRCELTYDRLGKIIRYFNGRTSGPQANLFNHLLTLYGSEYFFDEVDSLSESIEPTFDVVMPLTHSFWSNGIVSHNTTLMLQRIANAQRFGRRCAFFDMEHNLDPGYAKKLGVDFGTLLFSQPDHGEQCLEMAIRVVESGLYHMVVVDSVAALVPKEEMEGEMGDQQMGLQARMMSKACRKISAALGRKVPCNVMFTNQIREKIGILFGSPETTPGGRALKFYSSYRVDVRKGENIVDKHTGVQLGQYMKLRVIKNKVGSPFRSCVAPLRYGTGIDMFLELAELAPKAGVVEEGSGSYFRYKGKAIAHGTDQLADAFRNDAQLRYDVYNELLTKNLDEQGYHPDGTLIPGRAIVKAPTMVEVFNPAAEGLAHEVTDQETADETDEDPVEPKQ